MKHGYRQQCLPDLLEPAPASKRVCTVIGPCDPLTDGVEEQLGAGQRIGREVLCDFIVFIRAPCVSPVREQEARRVAVAQRAGNLEGGRRGGQGHSGKGLKLLFL